MSNAERRRHPRIPLHAQVEIEWGSEILRGVATDISQGGLFIETSDPLWVGAAFSGRVLLADPLAVECVVRRVVPGQGMGVEFDRLSNESRQRLLQLLESFQPG